MSEGEIMLAAPPEWSNQFSDPLYFQGVSVKRVLAYLIDMVVVFLLCAMVWFATMLLAIMSLGLLTPLHVIAVILAPLAYHTLMIASSRCATLGMRAMNIRVVSIAPLADAGNGRPSLFQAMILTVVFYGSVAITGSLILLIVLFNDRRRTLHDWLAGTMVVNEFPRR